MIKLNKKFRQGAVSIFIVIFTTLLLIIITTSFSIVMIREQQRASDADLSQSAYDSALAGVEDAKRALIKYKTDICKNNKTQCDKILKNELSGKSCDPIKTILGNGVYDTNKNEYPLQTVTGDIDLDQAYTCVKIAYDTADFVGEIKNNNSQVIIPLRPTKSGVKKIKLNWYNDQDNDGPDIDIPNNVPRDLLFPRDDNWPTSNRPPVLVVQYFKLTSDLGNYDLPESHKFYKTLYLYPSRLETSASFNLDARGSSTTPLAYAKCNDSFSSEYACSMTIDLPEEIKSRHTYVRITKRYSPSANFQLQMLDGANQVVAFAGVQPLVDSNGRANDMFRRVQARVQFLGGMNDLAYPSGALEISKGDFCKNMAVTKDNSNIACD